MNTQKEHLNRKKNKTKAKTKKQAGKPSKFLAFMIPKAEGSEMERKKDTDAKIKLVLSYTSEEYSELYLIKHSRVYCEPEIPCTFSPVPLYKLADTSREATKGSTVHTPETMYLEEKYFFLTFSVLIYVH